MARSVCRLGALCAATEQSRALDGERDDQDPVSVAGYSTDLNTTLTETFDPEEREQLAAEIFTYLYEQYSDMPIAAVRAQLVVSPEIVADWPFPGVTTTGLSHWHLIEPAS